jgi:hypothetical protein
MCENVYVYVCVSLCVYERDGETFKTHSFNSLNFAAKNGFAMPP